MLNVVQYRAKQAYRLETEHRGGAEVVALRNQINIRVIGVTVVGGFQDVMFTAVWQCLQDARDAPEMAGPCIVDDKFARSVTLHRLAVDMQTAVLALDLVTRQSDDALNVIGRIVGRQFEYRDIAAFGQIGEDAS